MAGATMTLAEFEGLGQVTMCGCGVVTLHLGGVSVRMEVGAFLQMAAMVEQGREALLLEGAAGMRAGASSRLTH